MFRAPDVGAVKLLGVTSETPVYDFLRLHYAESKDYRLDISARINVGLSRTVAALATGSLWEFLPGSNALVVRIFVKTVPNSVMFMTVPTSHFADIFPLHGRRL
jgi:hypothetical protein